MKLCGRGTTVTLRASGPPGADRDRSRARLNAALEAYYGARVPAIELTRHLEQIAAEIIPALG